MQHSHAIGGKEGLKQMRYLDHWSKKNESCQVFKWTIMWLR